MVALPPAIPFTLQFTGVPEPVALKTCVLPKTTFAARGETARLAGAGVGVGVGLGAGVGVGCDPSRELWESAPPPQATMLLSRMIASVKTNNC